MSRSTVQSAGAWRWAFSLAVTMGYAGIGGCTLLHPLDDLAVEGEGGAGGTGAGGQGGFAIPCEAGPVVGACGEGNKCTLAAPGEGLAGGLTCGPAGAVAAWSPCGADADCVDGTYCEEATSVCKPWCTDASKCPTGAACVPARRLDGTAVVGWTVCTAHCRLDNPAARCGVGATCVLRKIDLGAGPVDEGDCAASGGKTAGCICNVSADCGPGLGCDPDDLKCHAWCNAGGICAGGGNCSPALVNYDGTGFGQCAAPMCFNN